MYPEYVLEGGSTKYKGCSTTTATQIWEIHWDIILVELEKNLKDQNTYWEHYKYTAVLQESKYPRCVHVGM